MTKSETILLLEQDGLHEEAARLRAARNTKLCNICKTLVVPYPKHACHLCD